MDNNELQLASNELCGHLYFCMRLTWNDITSSKNKNCTKMKVIIKTNNHDT